MRMKRVSADDVNLYDLTQGGTELLYEMAVGGTMSGIAWGGGRGYSWAVEKVQSLYTDPIGIVDVTPPESTRPLQEEGISEILDVGTSSLQLKLEVVMKQYKVLLEKI